ncbi:MAG: hypothetical protein ACREI7_02120, partial [Myxococcota bacterium]
MVHLEHSGAVDASGLDPESQLGDVGKRPLDGSWHAGVLPVRRDAELGPAMNAYGHRDEPQIGPATQL